MKQKILFAATSLLGLPMIALADDAIKPIESTKSLAEIISGITGWILTFAGALAVLFIIIGGIRYIASAGNPEQAGAAKKTILYAIIGLIVILLSYAIKDVTISAVTSFF